MEEGGLSVEGLVLYEFSRPLSGGIEKRYSDRVLFDLGATLALDTIVGLDGATFHARMLAMAGGNGSDDVGDIQIYSNIAVDDDFAQLAELWYEQRWPGDAFRLKIGKVDANSEFAYADTANEFIHSSSGFSPTIFVFPTFPDPAVSVNLFLTPTEGVQIGVGVYNADDDGAYSGRRFLSARFDEVYAIAEAAFSWEHLGLAQAGDGRLRIGAWHHTGEFAKFDGGTENGTHGYYLVADREIWRADQDDREDSRALRMFFQYGWADQDVSDFQHHVGLGFEHTGLFPCREIDTTGLMANYADLSDIPSAGFRHDEIAFEVFHHFQVTPYLGIKPALQYIVNPSGSQAIDDALVATIRFEVRL